ncbi:MULTISPECIES: hypothetical protein [unclassified Kitasatospora]|uniref:hypothetical protein n=1 Tax=unclassified Kitasatospora TaxID=2633591 RepID=UPI0034059CF9
MSVRRLVRKAALPILIGVAVLTTGLLSSGGGQAATADTAIVAVADDLHWN